MQRRFIARSGWSGEGAGEYGSLCGNRKFKKDEAGVADHAQKRHKHHQEEYPCHDGHDLEIAGVADRLVDPGEDLGGRGSSGVIDGCGAVGACLHGGIDGLPARRTWQHSYC